MKIEFVFAYAGKSERLTADVAKFSHPSATNVAMNVLAAASVALGAPSLRSVVLLAAKRV